MSGYAAITTSLLKKYDEPGPRYTSYPTAPVWSEDFSEKDWIDALAEGDKDEDSPFSLYVHIPFCKSLCLYCGCSVVVTPDVNRGVRYVDTVLEEAELLSRHLPRRRKVQRHHWGGGTPTFLPAEEMVRLYQGIQGLFPSIPDAEVGIEVDPQVTTKEQLHALREAGFNRISMGVQDFTREVQETVRRNQSKELTLGLIEESKELGFESVNVDLIYGLPKQSLEGFGDTLRTVIDWGVERVACYSFAYVPWLKKHQRGLPREHLPDRDLKFRLFTLALETFGEAGYEAIGLDHFAKPSDPLSEAAKKGNLHRNFMGYTTRMSSGRRPEDMIMLGITSIGEVAGRFAQNAKRIKVWEEGIMGGVFPVEKGHRRTMEDEERRRIILDLMCQFRLEFSDYEKAGQPPFRERFREQIETLSRMQEDGITRFDEKGITVTEKGRIFLRNVAMPFDAYLQQQRKEGKPVFSRTV